MKKLLKSVIVGLAAGLLVGAVANAQTTLYTNFNFVGPSAGTNYATNGQLILGAGGYYITEIDVTAGTTSNGVTGVVTLYDTTNCQGTNGPCYVNTNASTNVVRTEVTTNIVSVLTNNSTGVVYTNTYPGQYAIFTSTTNANGTTNSANPIVLFAVPQNNIQRRTGQRITLVYGLMGTATTSNLAVQVFYSPIF